MYDSINLIEISRNFKEIFDGNNIWVYPEPFLYYNWVVFVIIPS